MTAADEKARIWGADRRVAKAIDRIFIVVVVGIYDLVNISSDLLLFC